jgi:hypothetical protein
MENIGMIKTLQPLDNKGAKVKSLLICLLAGCLVGPVCAQERNWTLEEFVQKLEDGQPWTREKAEAQLGVELTKTSSTGGVTWWYKGPESLVIYGEGLIVNDISYTVWAKTDEMRGMRANEMRSMRIRFDEQSNCFTQKQIKKTYPGGKFSDINLRPGGSYDYEINRGWGFVAFEFGDQKKWECLTGISITTKIIIRTYK